MDEITQGLYDACKAALPHFTNPKSLVAHQIRAAMACADKGHLPRRPSLPSVDPKIVRSEARAIALEQDRPEALRGMHL